MRALFVSALVIIPPPPRTCDAHGAAGSFLNVIVLAGESFQAQSGSLFDLPLKNMCWLFAFTVRASQGFELPVVKARGGKHFQPTYDT